MKDWETRLKKEENIRLDWTKTEIPRLGARSAPDLLNIDYNEKPSLTRPNLYPYYYPLPTPPAAPISITFFIDDWTGPAVDSNVSSYWPSHLDRMADHDSPEKFPSFASKISGSTPLNGLYPYGDTLSRWLPLALHSSTDKRLPIFLIDTVSSAQTTAFRNQKRSIASRGIVSFWPSKGPTHCASRPSFLPVPPIFLPPAPINPDIKQLFTSTAQELTATVPVQGVLYLLAESKSRAEKVNVDKVVSSDDDCVVGFRPLTEDFYQKQGALDICRSRRGLWTRN